MPTKKKAVKKAARSAVKKTASKSRKVAKFEFDHHSDDVLTAIGLTDVDIQSMTRWTVDAYNVWVNRPGSSSHIIESIESRLAVDAKYARFLALLIQQGYRELVTEKIATPLFHPKSVTRHMWVSIKETVSTCGDGLVFIWSKIRTYARICWRTIRLFAGK